MPPSLRIDAWTWRASATDGVAVATGTVTNISDTTARGVSATVEFYAADGSLVATGTAHTHERILGPGETTDFEAKARYDARITSARLTFIARGGRLLKTSETVEAPARRH